MQTACQDLNLLIDQTVRNDGRSVSILVNQESITCVIQCKVGFTEMAYFAVGKAYKNKKSNKINTNSVNNPDRLLAYNGVVWYARLVP